MAIFHLSARHPIARAAGRSATAAAAYRAGIAIFDSRTGITFDYSRRHGVLDARIQLPGGHPVADRSNFWNSVELHHRRGDAVTAREVVVALPVELDAEERADLAFRFAREIAEEYGVAVDCALHSPSRDGDDRNYHAHLLLTACQIDVDGGLGKKASRLDPIACRLSRTPDSVSWLRPRWQDMVNAALACKGAIERVDHRSFEARGITQHPTIHVGKRGALVRLRANRNVRLRDKNARAAALEEQINKQMRMRERLAARRRDGSEPAPEKGLVPLPNKSHLAGLALASSHLKIIAEDRTSDLLPWRRRKKHQSVSQDEVAVSAKPENQNFRAAANPPVGGVRRTVDRLRR